jgi:cell division protein ZapE
MSERLHPSAPSQRWLEGVEIGRWQDDPAQRAVLPVLDRIHAAIGARPTDRNWIGRMASRWLRSAGIRGLYLHGGVGRGKTFLVDLLHDGLERGASRRVHFHRFMSRVHQDLAGLRDQADPLASVARRLANRPLLVLDEFFVADIGDAMILHELLRHLFEAGVTLVTTSNIEPSGLYRDGLQRTRFLPAIELIEHHCEVVELLGPTDYRLRALVRSPLWLVPPGAASDQRLGTVYDALTPGSDRPERTILVNDRPIEARRRGDGIAWFDFAELCEGPRAVADYIELARTHGTVLISGVPRFDDNSNDPARRFVHLVDEFYDRGVKLVASSTVPIAALYAGTRLLREFERTTSRLIEMQGEHFLAREHIG